MKKKDINLIMAAVAILVMLKTMINRAFNEMDEEDEDFDDDDYDYDLEYDEDEDDEPYQVSDEEYEHFNEILEAVDFDNLSEEELGDLDLKHLLQSFNDSLEFKLAIMKNSTVLKEMLLKKKEAAEEEIGGEAVSDV